jgi:CTD kinase subunit alpha
MTTREWGILGHLFRHHRLNRTAIAEAFSAEREKREKARALTRRWMMPDELLFGSFLVDAADTSKQKCAKCRWPLRLVTLEVGETGHTIVGKCCGVVVRKTCSLKGVGTAGSVFEINRGGKKSAVKRVMANAEDVGENERTLREILVLRYLSGSDHVVKFLGHVFADSVAFIVMESLDYTLAELLWKNKGGLDSERALGLALHLFYGLTYVHRKGIVHADIKPANLMLDSKGTLKIVDMSLAQVCWCQAQDGSPCGLRKNTVLVTVNYRCPSLILGSLYYDASIDIWAAGAVLFELLYAREAFKTEAEGHDNKRSSVLSEQYRRLGTPGLESSLARLPRYHLSPYFPRPSEPLDEPDLEEKLCPRSLNLLLSLLFLDSWKRPKAQAAAEECRGAVQEEKKRA